MKKGIVLFFCLALMAASTQSFAQLSKKEKKEWKKKAKEFKKAPQNLKQLTEDKQVADNNVASLNQKVSQMQLTISDKDARIAQLEDELSKMRAQLTSARAELAQLKEAPVVNSMDFSKGVVFKVQIGAFKNKNLQSILTIIRTSAARQKAANRKNLPLVSFGITGRLIPSRNICVKWV